MRPELFEDLGLRLPAYPSGMSVSSRGLQLLADALRRRRGELRTRWRRLTSGRQALLVDSRHAAVSSIGDLNHALRTLPHSCGG
jgi:hypothetical protein